MPARVISIFNQKGGCGKTTVAIHLAGTFALRRHRCLVVDMDPQGTSTRWSANAPDDRPFPAALINLAQMGGKMHRELKNHIDNYDYIVIDCPPSIESPVPSSALLVSDLAIIPAVPSPADIWAIVEAKRLVANAQAINDALAMRIVANMVQRNLSITRSALAILSEDPDMPMLETKVGLRAAFRECQAIGTTVHAVPRAIDAVREVEALADEVASILN